LNRVWRLVDRHADSFAKEPRTAIPSGLEGPARDLHRKTHQTIARVTADIEERIHLNTAVAALMELANEIHRLEPELASGAGPAVLREAVETLVLLLNPFTPHVCEEMWEKMGHREGLVGAAWPAFDAEAAREDAIELAVQVNGKVRGRITVAPGTAEEKVREMALAEIASHVNGKQVVKVVVVPGRLVSVVLR
jgi:leucyl-tRNA synthetase